MKTIILQVVFLLCALQAFSQQKITIIDKTTRQPVPGVNLYTPDKKSVAVANARGQADISVFKISDSVYLQHIGYQILRLVLTEEIILSGKIELTESNIPLDEFVVSASRWEEDKTEIPYRVEKMELRDISFQNPQTSADLLGNSGYAYIQKSQMAGGSPMLRGFSTNRVMLVIDGVRINNAIFRTGNVQNVISLDANSMQEAEILFGPGAVMYGSDAIGGVMDFHTLDPKFADSSSLLFTGSAFARYSTANKEKTAHLDFTIGLKKWSFVTGFSYADYEDLKAGSKGNDYFLRPTYQETINGTDTQFVNPDPQLQVHSGYSQMNFLQKIIFKPNKKWEINYAIHYSAASDAPRYDRLTLDANNDTVLDNAQWYYGPQKWMMNRLGIKHSEKTKLYDQVRVVMAAQSYEESRHDRKTGSSSIRHQTETVNAFSVNVDFDKKASEKFSLFYGTEAIMNLVGSVSARENSITGEVTPNITRYPDGSTWESYSVYSAIKYKMSPRWVMNAGCRYSYFRIVADFDTTLFPLPFVHAENKNGSLNGSLGFVFNPDEKWQIYINTSTGFRAPNIDDIGKVFESEPGSVVVPNPNLQPEYAYNGELGTSKVFGDFMKAEMSMYYTYLDNALARRDFTYNGQDSILYDGQMSRVQAIQNISNAYVYGIQAAVKIYFGKGFGINSVINYQKGEEQSPDSAKYYPLTHAAPLFGSTHLTWTYKKVKAEFYSRYNAGMDFEDLSLADRNDDAPFAKDENGLPFVPAWYTLNIKAAWYINKNLSLNAAVENITDQLYRPFASGISAPGRNYSLTLRANF